METTMFIDLVAALGRIARRMSSFPRNVRDRYRELMDGTYRLIDTTLNMVIIRLGDILAAGGDPHFLEEVARLDNYDEWLRAEREFRLCKSLRSAVREAETLTREISGALSTSDWDALVEQMRVVLAAEGELAFFISERFQSLAARASLGTTSVDEVRRDLEAFRNALIRERQELIRQEVQVYSLV